MRPDLQSWTDAPASLIARWRIAASGHVGAKIEADDLAINDVSIPANQVQPALRQPLRRDEFRAGHAGRRPQGLTPAVNELICA